MKLFALILMTLILQVIDVMKIEKRVVLFAVLFFHINIIFFSCSSLDSNELGGYYNVVSHCEMNGQELTFSSNQFSIFSTKEPGKYSIDMATPRERLNSDTKIGKRLTAQVEDRNGVKYLIIFDEVSGFWTGVYEITGDSRTEGAKRLLIESGERRVEMAEPPPFYRGSGSAVCTGCPYVTVLCE